MTEEEIKEWKRKIDMMEHYEMAWEWRYASPGSPLFDTTTPLAKYFNERFQEFGGMTPALSKQLGWKMANK